MVEKGVCALVAELSELHGNLKGAEIAYRIMVYSKPLIDEELKLNWRDAYSSFLFRQERFNEAENIIRKTLQMNPERGSSHYILSMILLREKKINEAIEEYRICKNLGYEIHNNDICYWAELETLEQFLPKAF